MLRNRGLLPASEVSYSTKLAVEPRFMSPVGGFAP